MLLTMKALSVRQPHANRIATGIKTIELRYRTTKYRGDVLICASKFKTPGFETLPRGVALCVVSLVDSRLMVESDAEKACYPYQSGLWSWILENVRPVESFPVRGALSFFDVTMPQPGQVLQTAAPLLFE